jgi:hypothetical protein
MMTELELRSGSWSSDVWPVWRVCGEDFDVDDFLARFPAIQARRTWRRGEPMSQLRPAPNVDSGFAVTFEDATDAEDAVATCCRYFSELESALREIGSKSLSSTLDLGLTISTRKVAMRSVRVSPSLLGLLGNLGVTLELTMYLSDEE